ncbi:MAG TPA: hypothetical protein P5531_01005 [Bacteroidales bacterium]|nr:hypothetical protein [Bacteroidales bacterium]HSA42235.1 hypothetical protein [Bacteroidales bacterium]
MKHISLLPALIIILICSTGLDAQSGSDTSEYKRYYYENGKLSSEGWLRQGTPDGYWKTYHENGKLKSEGNRREFELDSLWKFYDEDGNIILSLEYRKGKKHGTKTTYVEGERIDEVFADDVKQGFMTYYFPDGKKKKEIPFSKGLEDGFAREYDQEGNVITLMEYKKGFLVSREYVNRRDKEGLAHGKWVTFWENGNIRSEGTYRAGKKNGYFREYTTDGKLFKIFKYINDELQEDAEEIARIDERADYYPSGKVKIRAQYKNQVPDGLWREFTEDGKLEKSLLYRRGIIVGEGITDDAGLRQGPWTEFYDDGRKKAEGRYKDGKRIGYWKFYYWNGNLEEEGNFDQRGRADGDWKWYHETGTVLREMAFTNGREDGLMTEYSEDGKVIARGEYLDGLEQGKWIYDYGDHREEGTYLNGQRDGEWQYYYENGNRGFEGKFVEDLPDGRHVYYWESGLKKDEGVYVMGEREGDWIKYNPDGTPFLIVTYRKGREIRYDGVKIKPELKDNE